MPEQDQAAPAKKAAAKKAAKKAAPAKKAAAAPNEAPSQHFEDADVAKVVMRDADPDHARKAAADQAKKAAAERRAEHVAGLENELAYLERQPKPNKARIDAVKAQIDHYSKAPKSASLETA